MFLSEFLNVKMFRIGFVDMVHVIQLMVSCLCNNLLTCTDDWVLPRTPHIQAGHKYFSGSFSVTSCQAIRGHPRR